MVITSNHLPNNARVLSCAKHEMQWEEVCTAPLEKGLHREESKSVILLEQMLPGFLSCAGHSAEVNEAGPCPQEAQAFGNTL